MPVQALAYARTGVGVCPYGRGPLPVRAWADAAASKTLQYNENTNNFLYSFFFCLQLFGYQLEIRKKK